MDYFPQNHPVFFYVDNGDGSDIQFPVRWKESVVHDVLDNTTHLLDYFDLTYTDIIDLTAEEDDDDTASNGSIPSTVYNTRTNSCIYLNCPYWPTPEEMETDDDSDDSDYELEEDDINHAFIPTLNTNCSDLSLSTSDSLSSLSSPSKVDCCLTCVGSYGPCRECYQWQYRNKCANK